jgi:hypothetical protein
MKFPEVCCEREDCKIIYLGSSSTLLGYIPVYNKNGDLLTKDPNKTRHRFQCTICNTMFQTTE